MRSGKKREDQDNNGEPVESRESILIVDDDENQRKSLSRILKKKGYLVETAGTGSEALEIAGSRPISIALLDIRLPDTDGTNLIGPFKQFNPDMAIIMVTGFSSVENTVRSMNAGASGYLIKPINNDDFLVKITELLERQELVREKRQVEAALRESEDRFRKIFTNSPLGMTLVTPDFRFFSVNPAWESMTGYTEAELLTMSFKDITHPDHLAGDLKPIQELVEGRIPFYSTEKRYIRKDRSVLWGLLRVTTILDQQGSLRHFTAQIEDITERKRAEELREHLISELAKKNTELDRFTYTVSHDLKSPLIAIRAFLSLLEQDLKSGTSEQVKADITRISESAEKLESLINTLLALSRSGKSADTQVLIPFSDLTHEAARLLEPSWHNRMITVIIPDRMPVVSGDQLRLIQVMTNLIDNAVKFMGDQQEPCIKIGVQDYAVTPVFFVQDNGMGIKKENLSKIFGLFERFNTDIPGTGIGLATVKRIIEAHGGEIWAESEGLGKGTTVCFTLPVKR
jgi:PAS domain S-box-containing protein